MRLGTHSFCISSVECSDLRCVLVLTVSVPPPLSVLIWDTSWYSRFLYLLLWVFWFKMRLGTHGFCICPAECSDLRCVLVLTVSVSLPWSVLIWDASWYSQFLYFPHWVFWFEIHLGTHGFCISSSECSDLRCVLVLTVSISAPLSVLIWDVSWYSQFLYLFHGVFWFEMRLGTHSFCISPAECSDLRYILVLTVSVSPPLSVLIWDASWYSWFLYLPRWVFWFEMRLGTHSFCISSMECSDLRCVLVLTVSVSPPLSVLIWDTSWYSRFLYLLLWVFWFEMRVGTHGFCICPTECSDLRCVLVLTVSVSLPRSVLIWDASWYSRFLYLLRWVFWFKMRLGTHGFCISSAECSDLRCVLVLTVSASPPLSVLI